MAAELMIPNAAIRNLIRENKIHQIYSQLQLGQEKYGMQTLNQALASLVNKKIISEEDAYNRSSDIEELKQAISSGVMSKGGLANNAGASMSNKTGQNSMDGDRPFSGIDFGNL
jgi:twitching motility protein PilT